MGEAVGVGCGWPRVVDLHRLGVLEFTALGQNNLCEPCVTHLHNVNDSDHH